MKKKIVKCYVVFFWGFILLPWLAWWGYCMSHDAINDENREWATMPQFSFDNLVNISIDFDSYINDRFPFRHNLTTANAVLDYYLFKTNTFSDDVIIGKDNWLYYNNKRDGDSMASYRGEDVLSTEELQKFAKKCEDVNNALKEKNIEFVLFIVPNKERIYYEYFPDYYEPPREEYRAKQIVTYLKEKTDIRVVYPYEALMEAKEESIYNIWKKKDTHWNNIGAYVGERELLKELGVEMPKLSDSSISLVEGELYKGDLARMISLTDVLYQYDREYRVVGYENNNARKIRDDFYEYIEYESEASDDRVVYVCRDSFFSDIDDILGVNFKHTYLRHKRSYSYNDMLDQGCDIFVYETVERYLDEFESFDMTK